MKNEIIIHRVHRVEEDRNYRTAGARLVEIGNSYGAEDWHLEGAISERTAGVAYIFGPRPAGAIPLQRVIEIGQRNRIPVLIDAAAMLPPKENLTRFISMGADMVAFSGGKGIRGPQSTGILCGRRDLIEAAYKSSSPNHDGIGRAAKVCKEEIAGLITALELFVDTDQNAEISRWRVKCERIANGLHGIAGVRVQVTEVQPQWDELTLNYPRVVVSFENAWTGPREDAVIQMLRDGDPRIWVSRAGYYGGIAVVPVNLQDSEEELILRRMREVLRTP
jgi:L-seryl-tRNA(Ser) seleniumtransferase